MKTCLARLADKQTNDVLHFPKMESLAIGYIASCLRENSFKTEIVDEEVFGFPREQTIKRLKGAELVGFSAMAKTQIFSIIETVKELRKQGFRNHVSIGGHYATFLYKELLELPNIFDSVARFEGEQTFVELAQAIEKGKRLTGIKGLAFKEKNQIFQNPLRPLIEDLDQMPFPARDSLARVLEEGGLATISSSRGCYNKCSYCTISSFYSRPRGKPFRLRSAKNVLAELQELKQNFPGLNEMWFVDDNFVMPGKKGLERTVELCRGIKKLGLQFDIYLRANDVNEKILKLLKESGLRNIFIGAEAANDFTLQEIFNKNVSAKQTLEAIKLCNRMKISVDPGFIMFHPWTTMKEIEQNIKFLEAAKQFTLYGIVSYLTPYTFTPIGQKMVKEEIDYKKPKMLPSQELNDFVPYEIQDKRAELLLCLTLKTFEEFRPLPARLSELSKEARRLKSLGKKEEAGKLERKWSNAVREMNQAGMKFFKELFYFMKETELKDSEIKPFFLKVRKRMQAYVKAAKANHGIVRKLEKETP